MALAGGLALALPLGALGAKRYDACPNKAVCVFADADLMGQRVTLTKRGLSNKVGDLMNDEASSVVNDRGKVAFLYTKRNARGVALCVPPHTYYVDLEEQNFNDKASSTKLTRRSECPGGET